MNLQPVSNIRPASFSYVNDRTSFQISLIIRLLSDSIKNGDAITLEDIRNLHAEYAMKSTRNGAGYAWFTDINGESKYRRAETKEEWIMAHSYPSLAVTWFKNNLGAAILKGKILAIPIIELSEKVSG